MTQGALLRHLVVIATVVVMCVAVVEGTAEAPDPEVSNLHQARAVEPHSKGDAKEETLATIGEAMGEHKPLDASANKLIGAVVSMVKSELKAKPSGSHKSKGRASKSTWRKTGARKGTIATAKFIGVLRGHRDAKGDACNCVLGKQGWSSTLNACRTGATTNEHEAKKCIVTEETRKCRAELSRVPKTLQMHFMWQHDGTKREFFRLPHEKANPKMLGQGEGASRKDATTTIKGKNRNATIKGKHKHWKKLKMLAKTRKGRTKGKNAKQEATDSRGKKKATPMKCEECKVFYRGKKECNALKARGICQWTGSNKNGKCCHIGTANLETHKNCFPIIPEMAAVSYNKVGSSRMAFRCTPKFRSCSSCAIPEKNTLGKIPHDGNMGMARAAELSSGCGACPVGEYPIYHTIGSQHFPTRTDGGQKMLQYNSFICGAPNEKYRETRCQPEYSKEMEAQGPSVGSCMTLIFSRFSLKLARDKPAITVKWHVGCTVWKRVVCMSTKRQADGKKVFRQTCASSKRIQFAYADSCKVRANLKYRGKRMLTKSDGSRENWWLTPKYKCESKGCPQLCGAHIIPQCYDRCKSSGSKHVDNQSKSTPYIKWVTIYGSKCYKTCQATIRRCQRIARNWDAHYKNLAIDFSQAKYWKKLGDGSHERTEYAEKASKKLADAIRKDFADCVVKVSKTTGMFRPLDRSLDYNTEGWWYKGTDTQSIRAKLGRHFATGSLGDVSNLDMVATSDGLDQESSRMGPKSALQKNPIQVITSKEGIKAVPELKQYQGKYGLCYELAMAH